MYGTMQKLCVPLISATDRNIGIKHGGEIYTTGQLAVSFSLGEKCAFSFRDNKMQGRGEVGKGGNEKRELRFLTTESLLVFSLCFSAAWGISSSFSLYFFYLDMMIGRAGITALFPAPRSA